MEHNGTYSKYNKGSSNLTSGLGVTVMFLQKMLHKSTATLFCSYHYWSLQLLLVGVGDIRQVQGKSCKVYNMIMSTQIMVLMCNTLSRAGRNRRTWIVHACKYDHDGVRDDTLEVHCCVSMWMSKVVSGADHSKGFI